MVIVSTFLPDGSPALSLLAKRRYRLVGTGLVPMPGECPVRIEPEYAPSLRPGGMDRLVHDSDLGAASKPLCDVLLSGSACSARGAVPVLETGVRVGASRKLIRVWGDRTLQVGTAGQLQLSAPEPFTIMPLGWDRAYGGRDAHAETKLYPKAKKAGTRPSFARRSAGESHGSISYPRNAAGLGFFIDLERARLDGAAAPNLEDPDDPVTPDRLLASGPFDWLDRPTAAGYGPIDLLTFPRVTFWLPPMADPPRRPVREIQLGALRQEHLAAREVSGGEVDPRIAQSAVPGLAMVFERRERVALFNLVPGRELVEFDVPPEVPELIVEPPGCAPSELSPRLKTILIEPDEGCVTLLWAGVMAVAAPFPDELCASMRRAVRWKP